MDKTFTPETSRPETQSQKTHTSAKSLLSLLQLNRSCSKMVYTYTPTYYSSLHDSITSICKNILPFSFKKKRLPAIAAAEQKLSKHQSDNLKWQQESFHQILNLMGLCKEGILQETEVSAFRSHLIDTLIASPLDYEHTVILRDKLIFLQELFYAKCITEEEYHSSKRPLLQRLAVQGAEIEARDLIIGELKAKSDEEWSAIDLKDEQTLIGKESLTSKSKSKHGSAIKPIKGAASVFGFVTSQKNGKLKEEKSVLDLGKENFGPIAQNFTSSACGKNELGLSQENPFWNCHVKDKESETRSILMSGSLPHESSAKVEKQSGGKFKKKPFGALFQRDEQGSRENGSVSAEREPKVGKKQWGCDGLKKWKKNDSEGETVPLSLNEKSDGETYLGKLVASPIGEGPDTKQIKKKLHSDGTPSDFFVDKVLGDKIKKELLRIQTELCATNPNALFSNDQIEAISTRLPVDKADLKKFFPKSWCDRYGDVVLDVVRKEFKNHVGEMKSQQTAAGEKQRWATFDGEMKSRQTAAGEMKRWTTFDGNDDENCHPNLFAPAPPQVHPVPMKQANFPPVTAERVMYSSRQY